MGKEMAIYFVLPSYCEDELSTSEEMQQAFELCRQNQMGPEWIGEGNCLTTNFNKKDIVVFEKFEGNTFDKIKTCLVVGPWCVITCLLEGLQIPNSKSSILNMAMYKLVVTASNYSPEQKKKMKEKVEMMGGEFSLHVTNKTTHLITNSVRTQKYAVANTNGKIVMLDSWIEDVWNSSLTRNVKATDEEFLKHKCPCFQNLQMCSTGFEIPERIKLQKLITDHGGTYSGKLATSQTDILVCKPGTKSEKLDVARRAKIPCVRVEWIYDSVEIGHAQPEKKYVIKVASSTPTKDDVPLNPDFSMMSVISGNDHIDPFKTSVSDSINVSLYNMTTPQANRVEKQKENQEPDIVAEIDLQTVRKAGTFLDGCCILLTGFTPERRDKLVRVLRSAGASRYDNFSERVTQVIVGDPGSHEARLVAGRAPLLSAAWIVESIRRGQPAPEEPYIINTTAQPSTPVAPSSPLSKKGLTLMKNDTSMIGEPEPQRQPDREPEEHETVKLYKENQTNNEEDTLAQLLAQGNINSKCETKSLAPQPNETGISDNEESCDLIFEGKTFRLIDHEDDLEPLIVIVEKLGGKVLENNNRGVADYAVTPPITGPIKEAATEIVNNIWLFECHNSMELISPKYYHHPLCIASDANPLKDCVITLSGYAGFERTFLIRIIQELGAIYQEKFARVTVENSNVLGSTHLVCLETKGSKWAAAQRWKKPVVTHLWLLRCAETGQRLPEEQFFLKELNEEECDASTTSIPVKHKKELLAPPEGPVTPVLTTSKRNERSKVTPLVDNKKISPVNAHTAIDSPAPFKRSNDGRKISPSDENKRIPVNPQAAMDSPTPINNKRDYEGNLIPPPTENKTSPTVSSVSNTNKNAEQKPGEDPMITLEDGTVLPLRSYMDELRSKGVFDTPSPVPRAESGTPVQEILSRLRREGKLQSETPTRNNGAEIGGSQGTPVGRYLRGLQERNVLPSSPKQGSSSSFDSPIPRSVFDVKTPETPLGRFLGEEDPSRSTRKHWQRYLDRIPHYPLHERPAAPPRRPSTPWSEVKRHAWSWLFQNKDGSECGNDSVASETIASVTSASEQPVAPELMTESQREVRNNIDQIQNYIRRRESSGPSRSVLLAGISTSSDPVPNITETKDSQTETEVGWDEPLEDCVFSETSEAVSGPRKFMMSSVDTSTRTSICNIIGSLGGEVSQEKNYDSTATHIVCSTLGRNEKILSSMAAGLWVLHTSYIEQSGAAGRFLSEEEYEFGNPKAEEHVASISSPITEAVHWWRERVRQTGKGAFHGMRALIFSKNLDAVIRFIEAGGGTVVQASPPFDHNIDATHCFLDQKLKLNVSEFIPLAEQGIPCLGVIYLSNVLINKTNVNLRDFIVPELNRYYNN